MYRTIMGTMHNALSSLASSFSTNVAAFRGGTGEMENERESDEPS
jgi:hypothetical protein